MENQPTRYSEDEIKSILESIDLSKATDDFFKWTKKQDGRSIINDYVSKEKSINDNQKTILYTYMSSSLPRIHFYERWDLQCKELNKKITAANEDEKY